MFCSELLPCSFVSTNNTLLSTFTHSTYITHNNNISVKQNVSTAGGIRTTVTGLCSHRPVTRPNLTFLQRALQYNYTIYSNKMHIFQINISIFNFFMSYTCFEPEDSLSGRGLYIQLRYGTWYMHQYKQPSRWKPEVKRPIGRPRR